MVVSVSPPGASSDILPAHKLVHCIIKSSSFFTQLQYFQVSVTTFKSHWINQLCSTVPWDKYPGYFCTVCIAVWCAGLFWYRYPLNLPPLLCCPHLFIEPLEYYSATNTVSILYRTLTAHCCSQCPARSLTRLTSLKVYPPPRILYDVCVKCKWGTPPPCCEQMYIMYIL